MTDELKESFLSREEIFSGRILTVHRDTVRLPDGKTALREVADHPGGVAVVALDDEGCVLTVEQYRYVFSRVLEEIPAGKLERGEDPRSAALRELREETGAVPGKLTELGRLLASPGCYGEILYLYLAEDLHFTQQSPDEDEFLRLRRTPLSELYARAMRGGIEDAKTVCGVLKVHAMQQEKEK